MKDYKKLARIPREERGMQDDKKLKGDRKKVAQRKIKLALREETREGQE